MNQSQANKIYLSTILILISVFTIVIILLWPDTEMLNDKEKEALKLENAALKGQLQLHLQERDSLKTEYIKLEAIYEHQKKYPQIIIKNYETKRDSINKLTPTESFNLFTNNINQYKYNRERYNLERFK